MLRVDRLEVMGMANALWFMRMPFESFNRADSKVVPGKGIAIGPNDEKLAKQLIKAGPEQCKFLRDIHVQMSVTATRYFWAECDTYHFITQISSSTMHLITKRHLTIDDFEHEGEIDEELAFTESTISYLNMLIDMYNDKKICDTEPLSLPKGILLWQDAGLLGHKPDGVDVYMPKRNLKEKNLLRKKSRRIREFQVLGLKSSMPSVE